MSGFSELSIVLSIQYRRFSYLLGDDKCWGFKNIEVDTVCRVNLFFTMTLQQWLPKIKKPHNFKKKNLQCGGICIQYMYPALGTYLVYRI